MNLPDQNAATAVKSPHARKIKWLVFAFLVVLAVVVVMNLPRGFSDDLARVGQGKPALVLIRDKNAVQSFDLIELMNGLRDQYAGKIEFLLTDFNTPQGRHFMETNEAPRVTLVLLDKAGNKVKVLYPPQTDGSLKQEFATLLESPL